MDAGLDTGKIGAAGVRGAGILKRWDAGAGVCGGCCWCTLRGAGCEGEDGGDGETRRRLCRSSVRKSISSSSSPPSSACSCPWSSASMFLCSMLRKTLYPSRSCSRSCSASAEEDGELSSILSRCNSLGGFTRSVDCIFAHPSSALSLPLLLFGALCFGATTKRFAGVTLRSSPAGVCASLEERTGLGVCAVKPWRRPDCGFGFALCDVAGLGARKRCGDGVCDGIVVEAFGASVRGRTGTVLFGKRDCWMCERYHHGGG